MAMARAWILAVMAMGLAGVLVLLAMSAEAGSPAQRGAVEVERWLVSPDGRFRRVTIVVDARVADPEAVADARYPEALRSPGVSAQYATFAKWAPGDVPIAVGYDDALDPVGIDGNPHLQWAMSSWNAVGGQSLAFANVGSTTALAPTCDANNGDGANTVRFSFLLDAGILGETCTLFDFDGIDGTERILEFDMHVDASSEWSVAAVTPGDRYDLRSVLLHELGHALGLDHSGSGNVMQPFLDTGEMLRTLSSDDIAGMRALYGVAAKPTPTRTPPPKESRPFRSTLGAISRD